MTVFRMHSANDSIRTFEELHRAIHLTLCQRENLFESEFRTLAIPLLAATAICGVQFILNGPRAVRLSAIWAAERGEVLLYDARGIRFEKLVLTESIPLPGHFADAA